MTQPVAAIRAGLERDGLAVTSVAREAVCEVLSEIGEVINRTQVRQIGAQRLTCAGTRLYRCTRTSPRRLSWPGGANTAAGMRQRAGDGHAVLP